MASNSHIHLTINTTLLDKLRVEAEREEISVSEMVRRKCEEKANDEELLLLRLLEEKIMEKHKNGK